MLHIRRKYTTFLRNRRSVDKLMSAMYDRNHQVTDIVKCIWDITEGPSVAVVSDTSNMSWSLSDMRHHVRKKERNGAPALARRPWALAPLPAGNVLCRGRVTCDIMWLLTHAGGMAGPAPHKQRCQQHIDCCRS